MIIFPIEDVFTQVFRRILRGGGHLEIWSIFAAQVALDIALLMGRPEKYEASIMEKDLQT